MAKIIISGREYDLRMGLWASEQIEKEYGDLQEALKKFRTERSVTMIRKMFVILANAGQKHAKQPMNVPEDVLDDATLGDLQEITKALGEAMDETMKMEVVGGEADDEHRDALAEEYDRKNGRTGGEYGPGNTTGTR